jgi:Flp pilus assembly protein TadD
VTSQETRPSAEDRLARARVEYARGDYPAAERSLEEALALAPGDARIHLMLGALHLRVRRFEGAARAFERGLALDPSEISRCPWVGHAYHELGDLEKARAWYGRVLEAAPENLEAKRGLALTLFKRGESQDAERLYRELRESAPAGSKARADAHRFLGEILLERGEAQAAALELLLAKAQSRFDPEIAYALSRAYAAAGDPARAEEERKAHEKLSRHRSGLEAMQARLRSNPRDREAWLGAASHLEEMGDGEEAEGTLRRAAALLPGDPAPRLALVDRFEKTSRKAEARALLEEAALLFPESPEVFERAFRFHRAAGDFEAMVQAAEAYYRLTGRPPR